MKLQPVLDILDEGLRLYRRGFVGFLLIVAIWLIPMLIGIGLTIGTAQFWEPAVTLLVALIWFVLLAVLAVYVVGVMSRATLTIQQEGRVNVRRSLAVHPFRLAGMGCYGFVYYLISNLFISSISMIIFCSFYLLTILLLSLGFLVADMTGPFGEAIAMMVVVVLVIFVILFYGLALALGGTTYSSLIYGLQPFVQERLGFGAAIERSINLTFYRTGYTLLAFLLSSVVFAVLAITVTIAIGVLLPLPLLMALGEESSIAQVGSALAWLVGLMVIIPPMPIWMVLLYQRNLACYLGTDLVERIAAAGRAGEEGAR
ncbi:MAG: hypothetical protein HC884_07065 [Chloroflexaceae bacterium]|nr:hypothetical protein [Chloroflexaceae bacterium]